MQIKLKITVTLSVIAILIAGCAAFTAYGSAMLEGRSAFNNGNYDHAVVKAAESLMIKPEYEPAQTLIKKAFRASNQEHKTKLDQLAISEGKFKWDDMVTEYKALIRIHSTVNKLPPITMASGEIIVLETADFSKNLAEAAKEAAEAHYQEGIKLEMTSHISDDINLKKQSAKEFKIASDFVPGYRDSAERYEEMRKAAILRMAVFFEDRSQTYGGYGPVTLTVMDNVVSSILNDQSATEFLELMTRDQLNRVIQEQALSQTGMTNELTAIEAGKILGINQILTGRITQIIYTIPQLTNNTRKVTRKVVTGEEEYTDKDGNKKTRKVRSNVSASFTKYSKRTSASIHGSYNIIDVETSKILRSNTFKESSSSRVEWGTFTGDARALSGLDKRLTAKGERPLPNAQTMVSQAASKLANSLANSIKEYAR